MSRTLLYFTPDVTDAKLFDRVRALRNSGYEVMSVGFSRLRYETGQTVDWPHLNLGSVCDGNYLERLKGFNRLFSSIKEMRAHLDSEKIEHRVVLARNLDMALMAWLILPYLKGAKFIYESLDVHPVMIKSSITGMLARTSEKIILNRAETLWTSSPSFISNYFEKHQSFKGDWSLIENKISVPAPRLSKVGSNQFLSPIIIGWFGTLRCSRSLDTICRIAEKLGNRVYFILRGYPARIGEDAFKSAIKNYPNIRLGGVYSPAELPEMMNNIHFSWSFDYSDPWGNSQWLRPNRIYEAGYYHRPVLADGMQETGRLVVERDLGWVFDGENLVEGLSTFLTNITSDDWLAKVAAISARHETDFAGNQDISIALNKLEAL